MIAEGWYDREFIRDWSNGALLVRDDNGRFLSAADLDAGGAAHAPRRLRTSASGARSSTTRARRARYTERVEDPLMLGAVRCATRSGPVGCRPAFERYAAALSRLPARAGRADHRACRAEQIVDDRAPALGAPPGGVLPLDRA